MWQEIRAGEFPTHACLHAICPTAFDPLQAPAGKHAASVFLPVPFQLKGKQPEDWVKLKNGFLDAVIKTWRRYATNLTDENIDHESGHGAPLHGRPLAQHAAWFGLGGAQDSDPDGRAAPHRTNLRLPHADPRVVSSRRGDASG